MKVHELCHISLFVKAFGPPMGNSCFPYGNANDLMKVGAWYKIHCLTGLQHRFVYWVIAFYYDLSWWKADHG